MSPPRSEQPGPAPAETLLRGLWLPLGCIGDMVDYSRPEVVRMCDFGNLDAGWSAIRDSEPRTIWAIFETFVLGENSAKR